MEQAFLKQIVEALVLASDVPISDHKIASYVEELSPKQVQKIVEELNSEYSTQNRAFFVTKVAGGYQINTRKEFAPWIKKMFKGRSKPKLSQAALESLAITAFRQPISRAEIDAIRGVHSGGVLKNLMERNLIAIAGRSEGLGKPLLYGTTGEFLRYFGINDISELPKPREIEEIMGKLDGAQDLSHEIVEVLTEVKEEPPEASDDAAK
ncbi:MAG: SMC-Scp complex subunit ScpB [bacterium]